MKALRFHGGGAVSRRISLRVGGRPVMLYRGDDASDEEEKLVGREYGVYDDSLKSSKADKGRGCCLGIVSRAPRGCRILGLTMLCDITPGCLIAMCVPWTSGKSALNGPLPKELWESTAIIPGVEDE